jgi:hypothetical protein
MKIKSFELRILVFNASFHNMKGVTERVQPTFSRRRRMLPNALSVTVKEAQGTSSQNY